MSGWLVYWETNHAQKDETNESCVSCTSSSDLVCPSEREPPKLIKVGPRRGNRVKSLAGQDLTVRVI